MRLLNLVLIALFISTKIIAQSPIVPEGDLITTGTYYYPEQWPEEYWESDIKKIAEMGFEFTHYGEFAWANMEPEEGEYTFEWLDKAVEIAEQNGLKVIMCTPTPTPPRWLTAKYPEILMKNDEGRIIQHGARAHASWSSKIYREYITKIVKKLGERYGNHPTIIGWQIDNEPSHYSSPWDYSDNAKVKFREWLKSKYKTIVQLNETWGNTFWSQTYQNFDQIEIPNKKELVQQPNPHAMLDFKRFTSDEAASFISFQADILREYVSKKQWITSNYMVFYESVDPAKNKDLDFVTYTRYLVAGYERGIGDQGFRLGIPEMLGMVSDYCRPIGGVTGVMELQPGQVNWGKYNPQPLPGAIRMWLWHAFAAGSDLACNYRYLTPLTGGEQYHNTMLKNDRNEVAKGGREYIQFMNEIKQLRGKKVSLELPKELQERKAAIVHSLDNRYEQDYQPQTDRWNYLGHLAKYYKALNRLNAPVDIISEDQPLDTYALVVVPAFQLLDEKLIAKWRDYAENGGNLMVTCRTGQKDREAKFWPTLWAKPIYDLIGGSIDFYDHLPPDVEGKIQFGDKAFTWNSWGEILTPNDGTDIWAKHSNQYYEGKATVIHRKLGKGTVTYVGTDSQNGDLELAALKKVYDKQDIPVWELPYGVVFNWRKGYWVGVNYSDKIYELDIDEKNIVYGESKLKPGGVVVYK